MDQSYKDLAALEARLLDYQGDDRVVSAADIQAEIAAAGIPETAFKTGLPQLDALTEGVHGGELICVAGKRKHGKTLLCQTLVQNFSEQGIHSLFFSYEVPYRQFMTQMPEGLGYYMPMRLAKRALDWIEERSLEAKIKFGTKAVFIDHLHFLIDMERTRNPSLEIGSIVRRLKRIAIDHDLVVFLISHVQKLEPNVEPTEDHLRDSGMTAAEADTTWIVSRIKKDSDKTADPNSVAKISVRNHRRTGVMAKNVQVIKRGKILVEDPKAIRQAGDACTTVPTLPLDDEADAQEVEVDF